jgi:hypothetical protein
MRNEAGLKKKSIHFELPSISEEEGSSLYQGLIYVSTVNSSIDMINCFEVNLQPPPSPTPRLTAVSVHHKS